MGVAKGYLPFTDPKIKWNVRPSLDYQKIITGNTPVTNSVQYSCDGVICIPRYYGGFLSWYDPSTGGVGNRMFDLQEAWDHDKWQNPNMSYPYNGKVGFVAGYGGYFLAVHLTDKSNIIQVNIIRRYTDDSILIYNTGKYGTTSYNINVTVNDPPSGLGYKKNTNGTTVTGGTRLAPGQYVLFYKGDTAPAVDAATGLFRTSPFGINKSQPYELWVNSFSDYNIVIPKMYLGVKTPKDMEIISNGCYIGPCMQNATSGASNLAHYPLFRPSGQDGFGVNPTYNVSHIGCSFEPIVGIMKEDPNTNLGYWYWGTFTDGYLSVGIWFGWGEDDVGNVKFILLSKFTIAVDTNFNERFRLYDAYIYDVDKDEAYFTSIVKLTVNTRSLDPVRVSSIFDDGNISATAFGYIDSTDTWYKITTSSSKFYDNSYGFCNFYNDKINCEEGLGIYTDDPNYTPPTPKAAFGANQYGKIGAHFIRISSLQRTLYANRIYAVVTRLKTFPGTTTDTDLQNWFKSLPPKVLTKDDFNALLGVLPGSFWLYGELVEEGSISVPDTITPGSRFTVNVSCPTRPNTTVWVFMVDPNGNIVASGSGTTDANGNATITLTAPSTIAVYRVVAIVKGSRTLI